jgi:hypothetical protein
MTAPKVIRRRAIPPPPKEPAAVPQKAQLLLPTATRKMDGSLTVKRRVVVLGIDASLTGWAITALSVEDETFYSWMYTSKYKGAMRLYDLAAYIENQLGSIRMQTGGVEHICLEGYSFGSPTNREAMGEVGGLTKYLLLRSFGWSRPTGSPRWWRRNR